MSAAFPQRDVHLHSTRPLRVRIEGGATATLGSLLQLAQRIEDELMWLPMAGEVGSCGAAAPPAATNLPVMNECVLQGFQVLAVRWCRKGPMPECLLTYRFDSAKVLRRLAAAVEDVVQTMDHDLAHGLIV